MRKATLLHNAKAGEESYSPEELVNKIESYGINCIYKSVKDESWVDMDEETDFLIIAGGDGTVRRVVEKLLDNKLFKKYPIALLPAGTANNIARTLDLSKNDDEVISAWKDDRRNKFDVGAIYNLPESKFFLESFGFGVFPVLMDEMNKQEKELKDTPEKKLQLALELLEKIIESYSPSYCELEIDGTDHSGKFFLVEIMNTQSIGPNLILSPHGDPGDGEFEVVLIPERQKEKLLNYVSNKLQGIEEPNLFDTCRAKKIKVKCDQLLGHVDDEIVEIKQSDVRIELVEGMIEFLVSENSKY